LVFDRCASAEQNQTRAPDGTCVDVTDCDEACPVGGGVRSAVLGVCTCNNDFGVDATCNQACRKSSPTVSFTSATSATVVEKDENGNIISETEIDLVTDSQMDVIGEAAPGRAVSAGMGAGGTFEGSYGAPSALTNLPSRRLLSAL
jgi:hypothetical protein